MPKKPTAAGNPDGPDWGNKQNMSKYSLEPKLWAQSRPMGTDYPHQKTGWNDRRGWYDRPEKNRHFD